jgi:two-component system nitrate/nitrite response regulator NarL
MSPGKPLSVSRRIRSGEDASRTQELLAGSPAQPIRIVIADNHPISRDGLRRLIESEPGLLIVGETSNSSEAWALVRDRQADVLLIDFPADSRTALETLRQVAGSAISVRTIILAENIDSPDLETALQLGARGVVVKESAAEVLFSGIRSVIAGHYWIAADHVSDAAASLRALEVQRRRRKAFGLTRRELEIVRAVVAGCTNDEIAQRFAITENTVKSHLTHVFNKLGASNRVELALFAAHHRLLDGR